MMKSGPIAAKTMISKRRRREQPARPDIAALGAALATSLAVLTRSVPQNLRGVAVDHDARRAADLEAAGSAPRAFCWRTMNASPSSEAHMDNACRCRNRRCSRRRRQDGFAPCRRRRAHARAGRRPSPCRMAWKPSGTDAVTTGAGRQAHLGRAVGGRHRSPSRKLVSPMKSATKRSAGRS